MKMKSTSLAAIAVFALMTQAHASALIANCTVKANANTGLAAPDVFSFGNLIGETGDGSGSSGWRVSALDLGAVKRAPVRRACRALLGTARCGGCRVGAVTFGPVAAQEIVDRLQHTARHPRGGPAGQAQHGDSESEDCCRPAAHQCCRQSRSPAINSSWREFISASRPASNGPGSTSSQ